MSKPQWTEPYYGITHYGELRDPRRVTVTVSDNFTELRLITREERDGNVKRGSTEEVFRKGEFPNHEKSAKSKGEKWVKGNDGLSAFDKLPVFLKWLRSSYPGVVIRDINAKKVLLHFAKGEVAV